MLSRFSIHSRSYLVREFYLRDALTPSSAVSLRELPFSLRMALRQLLHRRVVHEIRPGYYYLDGPAFERYWSVRARAVGVGLVIILILLASRLIWA